MAFSNKQDNNVGWRPWGVSWRRPYLENRYKGLYIKKYIYYESERMFNTYCEMYGLEGTCNHHVLTNLIYDRYSDDLSELLYYLDTSLAILDDSMRWELKPLRKTYKNVGDMTESIRCELESLLS